MKRTIINLTFIALGVLVSGTAFGQAKSEQPSKPATAVTAPTPQVDSVAVYILKRMSGNLQGAKSLSLRIETAYDVPSQDFGYVKHGNAATMRIQAPDKLFLENDGDKGRQTVVYDGARLQVYHFDDNTYAQIPVSGSVADMMAMVSTNYGIEFPAADFFYPDFVADAVATTTHLAYLGLANIDGKPCYHIISNEAGVVWQLWVSHDALTLPVRMVINYGEAQGCPQYQADYTNWNLGEATNDAIFKFERTPGAQEVKVKESINE